MTGMVDGLEVVAYQTKARPGKGAILITAFGSDEIRERARSLGREYFRAENADPRDGYQ